MKPRLLLALCLAPLSCFAAYDAREEARLKQEEAAVRYLESKPNLTPEQQRQLESLRARQRARQGGGRQRQDTPCPTPEAPRPLDRSEERELRRLERDPLPNAAEQRRRQELRTRDAEAEAAQPLSDRERQKLRRLERQEVLAPEELAERQKLQQRSEIEPGDERDSRRKSNHESKKRRLRDRD